MQVEMGARRRSSNKRARTCAPLLLRCRHPLWCERESLLERVCDPRGKKML
jgi:hypothetical protein